MAVDPHRAEALDRLVVETRLLFRSLRGAAERLHGEGQQTAARRSVLTELVAEGPRTVPAMAEARNVSRQAIQGLVNALANDGLVERIANPEHRRSWLWRATEQAAAHVRALRAREAEALGALDGPTVEAILAASATLEAVRAEVDRI